MNKKRIKNIILRWKGQWLYFSPLIAIGDFLCSTIFRFNNSRIKHIISKKYYNLAQIIITNRYKTVIEKWENKFDKKEKNTFEKINKSSRIFIFWWQGEENSPEIIKDCIFAIRSHAGEHAVTIIDKDTWMKYTNIPDYILKKVNEGIINFTLFSDILRCALLYDNGGIWIDPTCYVTRDFSDDMYNKTFYTIKHGDSWEFPICKGYWATYFLAAGKNNPLLGFSRDLFFEFWKKEKAFIVYLSIDLFFSIAYDNFDFAKKMIDDVPYNNRNRDDLRNKLANNGGKDFDILLSQVDKETYINKLTYKMYIEKYTK